MRSKTIGHGWWVLVFALSFSDISIGGGAETKLVPRGHVRSAQIVVFGKQGLATQSSDELLLWTRDGELKERNRGVKAQSAQVSPDGKRLAYLQMESATQSTIRVRSLVSARMEELLTIPLPDGHKDSLLRFTTDNKHLLATSGGREQWLVWDLQDGSPVSQPAPPDTQSEAFQARLQRLQLPRLSCTTDIVSILATLELAGPEATPLKLAPLPFAVDFVNGGYHVKDDLMVFADWSDTGSSTADTTVWSTKTGELIDLFQSPYSEKNDVFVDRTGEHFVRGIGSMKIEMRRTSGGQLVRSIGMPDGKKATAWAQHAKDWLILRSEMGQLIVWDMQTGKTLGTAAGSGKKMAFSTASLVVMDDHVLSLDGKSVTRLSLPALKQSPWPSNDGPTPRWRWPGAGTTSFPRGVAAHDRDRIVLTFDSGSSHLFNKDGMFLATLAETPFRKIILSPDGEWAMAASQSHSTPIWNVASGALAAELKPHALNAYFPSRSGQRRAISRDEANSSAGTFVIRPQRRGHPALRLQPNTRDVADHIEKLVTDAPKEVRPWLHSLRKTPVYFNKKLPLDGLQLMTRRQGELHPVIWNSGHAHRVIADYRDGTLLRTFELKGTHPTAATLSADGANIAIAFATADRNKMRHTVAVFQRKSGKLLHRNDATPKEVEHNWKIDGLTFSPNGNRIAVAFEYHNYMLELKGEQAGAASAYSLVGRRNGGLPTEPIAAFNSDGSRAIVLGYERVLWDVGEKQVIAKLGPYNGLWNYAFSPNGKWLFVDGHDGPRLINATTGSVRHKFQRNLAPRFPNEGKLLLPFTITKESPSLWDFQRGEPICPLTPGNGYHLRDATVSPDQKRLVVLESNQKMTITIYDIQTGEPIAHREEPNLALRYQNNGSSIRWLPDDRLLTVHDDEVVIWSGTTAEPLKRIAAPKPSSSSSPCYVVFPPLAGDSGKGDGASTSSMLIVRPGGAADLWDLQRFEKSVTLNEIPNLPHWAPIVLGAAELGTPTLAAFTQDGSKFYIVHEQWQSVVLWDVRSGDVVGRHHLVEGGTKWFAEP